MAQAPVPQHLINEAVAARKKAGSNAGAARLLGLASSTFDNRLNANKGAHEVKIKLLLLDIENAPHLGHVWGLWNQNISIKQLMEAGYTLCWAAKWYGEEKIYFNSIHQSSTKEMLVQIHKMLDECDAVIHYHGTRHDIPILNKEFILHGMKPPSPYKQIDLLRTVRSQFKFASNKLDYVAQVLGVGKKYAHEGHQLWVDCMAGVKGAWVNMKKYNIHDIVLLEGVYEKIKPWIKNHPNQGLYNADTECCPTCGSTNIKAKGYTYTNARRYKAYRCGSCGVPFRGGVDGQSRKFCPAQ